MSFIRCSVFTRACNRLSVYSVPDIKSVLNHKLAFIVNIMEHENPCIERVEQMVARHGAYETYRRCREFMVETEYDAELFLGENRFDWNKNGRMK